ncbi:MAG: DNA gyrase inhibitor YacG [Rubrivivax sp.]|nr:DNA gyrase inhibitor YacG [Rubrivivax sp.]MBK7263508.1 DNA gyrase inhibitor YacG [Rubrivivax sp.]MBK8525618.1 DNA gyrase inhibitor YacG [Rubrivivax sp.]
MVKQPVLEVPCPSCRRPSPFSAANRWRPFCSERCRSADLGAWASEAYRVPAETAPDSPVATPDEAPGRSAPH